MKTLLALFLACFTATLFAQPQPPLLRNVFTTNTQPQTNILSGTLRYISPPGGNNAVNDMLTNTPNYIGQVGVSQDDANAGRGVYLWGANSVNLGSNGWGAPIYIPSIGGLGSAFPYQSPKANIRTFDIDLNGNPGFADKTNMIQGAGLVDPTIFIRQYNPYGYAAIHFPSYTTNIAYNLFGSGTYVNAFTNRSGNPIVIFDNFGLTLGSIHPDWLAGVTNQAGAEVIILGGRNNNPFHISENVNLGASGLGQYPVFTYDRRGNTNAAFPIAVGFPARADGRWEPTQSNFQWHWVLDRQSGTVYQTNSGLVLSNLFVTSTNLAAGKFGGFAESVAEWNFSGGASFNAESFQGFNRAWTFDAAAGHRLGFYITSGQYPALAYAAGAPFQVIQSSQSDLQSGIPTATRTNMFLIDGDKAAFNTVGGLVISNRANGAFTIQTNGNEGVSSQTISGAGNGNTNYTLQATFGKMYLGSSNVNISALMGYSAGITYNCSVTITNLSASTWGVTFSAVTNRWRFIGQNNQTNSPSVLTNNTALVLRMEVDGTNILCDWKHYAPYP